MFELIMLGTGAGVSTSTRHHSGMAIKLNERLYILDCGCPVSTLLQQAGEDPKQIEAVFLTHWHPDHASGLPMLIQDLQLTGRRRKLKVLGPDGSLNKIQQLQRIFFLPPEIYPFSLEVLEYHEGFVFEDGNVRVRFFRTRHLSSERWKELDSAHDGKMRPVAYGLVVEVQGKTIVVSGDVLSPDDVIPVLPGADLVVHEFGHIPVQVLHDFAVRHEINNLLVTHIHHEWEKRGEELQNILSDGYRGQVRVAGDLMRITF